MKRLNISSIVVQLRMALWRKIWGVQVTRIMTLICYTQLSQQTQKLLLWLEKISFLVASSCRQPNRLELNVLSDLKTINAVNRREFNINIEEPLLSFSPALDAKERDHRAQPLDTTSKQVVRSRPEFPSLCCNRVSEGLVTFYQCDHAMQTGTDQLA